MSQLSDAELGLGCQGKITKSYTGECIHSHPEIDTFDNSWKDTKGFHSKYACSVPNGKSMVQYMCNGYWWNSKKKYLHLAKHLFPLQWIESFPHVEREAWWTGSCKRVCRSQCWLHWLLSVFYQALQLHWSLKKRKLRCNSGFALENFELV